MNREDMIKKLRRAEVWDAYRIFPRGLIVVLTIAMMLLTWYSWAWYTALPLAVVDTAALGIITAFPIFLIGTVSKFLKDIVVKYMENPKYTSPRNGVD